MSTDLKSSRTGLKRKLSDPQTKTSNGLCPKSPSLTHVGVGIKLRKQLTRGIRLRREKHASSPAEESSRPSVSLKKCLNSSPAADGLSGHISDHSPSDTASPSSYRTASAETLSDCHEANASHVQNRHRYYQNIITGSLTGVSRHQLREAIFHISMGKLTKYRYIPDPSLLKSVMICNTLKSLERDLDREGIRVNFGPNGVYFVPTPHNQINHHTTFDDHELPGNPQSTPSASQLSKSSMRFVPDTDPSDGRMTPFIKVDEDFEQDDEDSDEDVTTDLTPSEDNSNVRQFESQDTSSSSSEEDSTSQSGLSWRSSVMSLAPESVGSPSNECASRISSNNKMADLNDRKPLRVPSPGYLTPSPDFSDQPSPILVTSTPKLIGKQQLPVGLLTPGTPPPEDMFGDVDVSLYDFDLLSPLSLPNLTRASLVTPHDPSRQVASDENASLNSISISEVDRTLLEVIPANSKLSNCCSLKNEVSAPSDIPASGDS